MQAVDAQSPGDLAGGVELQGEAARRGGLAAPLVLILGSFVFGLTFIGRFAVGGRGKPLVSRAVVVSLIANTKTRTGLSIRAELDTNTYPTGIEVSDEELATVQITHNAFHGEWNYTIAPH